MVILQGERKCNPGHDDDDPVLIILSQQSPFTCQLDFQVTNVSF